MLKSDPTAGLATAPGSAGQASLRSHNLRLAYQTIAQAAAPVSRADIAGAAGLTRATASSLVDALVQGSLVEELDVRASGRAGRPATPVRLARGTVAGLGLEINVDYLAVKALDLAGQVLDERVQWTDLAGSDPTQAVLDLANLARPVRRRLTAQKVRLAGATLAVAGPVDRATGRLRSAPNLGWQDLDLLGLVRRRLRLPELKVGNEATLAARAELASLGDHQASFVYVSGGVGIGAGIVQHGALYSGSHGWAGELGHVTVDAAGPPCACGSNGCLEQYAGRSAILTAAGLATLPAAPRATAAGGTGDAGAGGLEGDPTAQALHAAMSQAGRALGIALSGAINLMDLNTVVLGGDFAHLIRLLLPALRQELELRVVSWGWAPDDQFVRPAAGPALPAVAGAALAAIDRVAANPAAYLAQ